MNIYVGNLPYEFTDGDLEAAFSQYGPVISARVIMDRFSGRSRGFGFVEMGDADGAKAIAAMNGKDMKGRALTVNEARPREGGPGGGRREGGQGGGMGGGRRDDRSGGQGQGQGGGRW